MSYPDDGVYRFECYACGETREAVEHECSVRTFSLESRGGYMGDAMEEQSDGYGDWLDAEDLPAIRTKAKADGAQEMVDKLRRVMSGRELDHVLAVVASLNTTKEPTP